MTRGMEKLRIFFASMLFCLAPFAASSQNGPVREIEDFSKNNLIIASAKYLGATAESMAEIIDNTFARYGTPDAVIRGEEISAAALFGVHYGKGQLQFKSGEQHTLFWRGPSAGIETGGNAAKSFTLVYNADTPKDLHRRFFGVDASVYYVGGLAINYMQRGSTILVTTRVGFGVRLGVSVGYLKFSPRSGWFPF